MQKPSGFGRAKFIVGGLLILAAVIARKVARLRPVAVVKG